MGIISSESHGWEDYELLDSGDGQRLERFGRYTLVRPDPQITWKPHLTAKEWDKADATFKKTDDSRGSWQTKRKLPEKWLIRYQNLYFYCKLSPFKHTGVFPEQAPQWDWIKEKISLANFQVSLLNLFGYTGLATLTAASIPKVQVTHVDASYPTIGWARENQVASKLTDRPIRWILDDALKFCQREVRRGSKYDAFIMDPPVYGHGPKGEVWDFNQSFPKLLGACQKLLSDRPLFFLVNAYAISTSSITLSNTLSDFLPQLKGQIEYGELILVEKDNSRLLSTGIFARWASDFTH